MTTNDDVLAETIGAMGEELSLFAGLRLTRLTTTWLVGQTTAPVESTLGWPASGKVLIDGTVYSYTGKTLVTLSGITFEDGGVQAGAKQDYLAATVIVDFSKSFSKLDQAISQLFVTRATGNELSIVGQNLGVDRPPGLGNDDVFREIIKALAYQPRGTFHGLELALTAFFGAGNFKVYENIPAFRNTVFIEVTGGFFLIPGFEGKTFLTRQETSLYNVATNQLTLAGATVIVQVEGVRLADERYTRSFRAAKPSATSEVLTGSIDPIVSKAATGVGTKFVDELVVGDRIRVTGEVRTVTALLSDTLLTVDAVFSDNANDTTPEVLTDEIRFVGDSGIPVWIFAGTNEAADVTVLTADEGCVQIVSSSANTAAYFHTARIRPESEAYFELNLDVTAISGTGMAFVMNLRDGARDIAVGLKKVSSTTFQVGFCDVAADTFIETPIGPYLIAGVNYRTFAIRKVGSRAQFLIGPAVVQEVDTGVFNATVKNEFRFGCQNTGGATSGSIFRVKLASFVAHTATDFWNLSGSTGVAIAPAIFDTNSGAIVATDAGKTLRVFNAPFVENNGYFVVLTATPPDNVTLGAWQHFLAIVETAHPDRVRIAFDKGAFKYPDDIGKKLELMATLSANQLPGGYVITAVLNPVDFTAFSGPDVEFSNIVTVDAASFVTETEIPWKLLPDFVVESGDFVPAGSMWELVDAGSVSGNVLTLRADPVLNIPGGYEIILETVYSEVLSAELLAGPEVDNNPAGAFHPFYLPSSPIGPFRSFIDNLTVAGVISEIKF